VRPFDAEQFATDLIGRREAAIVYAALLNVSRQVTLRGGRRGGRGALTGHWWPGSEWSRSRAEP
jgi:hypothetical protein